MENNLELWNVYNRKLNWETMNYDEELESVLNDREILMVRRKIGDIGDEEFNLKINAVNWDIEALSIKKHKLEKSISLLNSLGSQIENEDIDDFKKYAKNNYIVLKELELSIDIYEMFIDNFTSITDIIT